MEPSSSSETQKNYRNQIFEKFLELDSQSSRLNPGLILTTPLLSKVLSINNCYQKIQSIPGDCIEVGVWYCQNLILCENLRSIYEPFNIQRRFWGYDTFSGYPSAANEKFRDSYLIDDKEFKSLKSIILMHESSNTPSHINNKVNLVKGNIKDTISENSLPNIIALLMVDIDEFSACSHLFSNAIDNMPSGSIILFDDLTNPDQTGCMDAFKPYINQFRLENCPFFSTRVIATKK
jgi:hypothetical protein